MTPVVKTTERPTKDLIDRVAEALPAEVQADYYRELRHCRSLPENDEMLRILRAMQFLTLLIHSAPARLATERELLDHALAQCADALRNTIERLEKLPDEVSSGISPEAIASRINESLRQQFLQSTVPQTSDALATVAAQMKKTVAEFQQTAARISHVHQGAAAEANRAVQNIESSVLRAAIAARNAATELATNYSHQYRWSVTMIAAVALLAGILFGVAFQNWRSSPVPAPATPTAQTHKGKR